MADRSQVAIRLSTERQRVEDLMHRLAQQRGFDVPEPVKADPRVQDIADAQRIGDFLERLLAAAPKKPKTAA